MITETIHKTRQDNDTRSLRNDVVQVRNQTDQVPEAMHSIFCEDKMINNMSQGDAASFENDNAEPNTRPSQVNTEVLNGVNLTKMIDDIYHSNAAIDDQFGLVHTRPQRSQSAGQIRHGHKLNTIINRADTTAATSKHKKKSRAARLLEPKIAKASENNSQFNEASCFVPEAAKKRNTVSKVRAARRPRPKITKVSKKVNEDNAKNRPGLNANESSAILSPINGDKRNRSKENGTHEETSRFNDMQQQTTFPKSKEVSNLPGICVENMVLHPPNIYFYVG